MCVLWSMFCLKIQRALYGSIRKQDLIVLIVNFLFAPISMALAIIKKPKDKIKI